MHWHGGDRDVGPRLVVRGQHLAEIHAVKLVAGKNQHFFHVGLLEVAKVLPDGVGRASTVAVARQIVAQSRQVRMQSAIADASRVRSLSAHRVHIVEHD